MAISNVELLLNAAADINIQNHDKETPLHLATRNGHSSVVALLIARGANIEMISSGFDYKNDWYGSAVAVAAFFNHKDIVEMLHEKGAENPSLGGFRKCFSRRFASCCAKWKFRLPQLSVRCWC